MSDILEKNIRKKLNHIPSKQMDSKIEKFVYSTEEKSFSFAFKLAPVALAIMIAWGVWLQQPQIHSPKKVNVAIVVENIEMLENMDELALLDNIDLSNEEWEVLLSEN